MRVPGPLICVTAIEPLEPFRARISFADGTIKIVDLAPYLCGPIFEPIGNNPELFRSMKVSGNTLAWENGADIDPDVLYYDLKPEWMEHVQAAD